MALSGGLKVDRAPFIDQSHPPKEVTFSPEDLKSIAKGETKYLALYPEVAAQMEKLYPRLDEQLRTAQFDSSGTFTDKIKQPTTAGKAEKKPDVVFRIEVIDKKGRIIGYHEVRPQHRVTDASDDALPGRIDRVYDAYADQRQRVIDEATGSRDHMRRASVELDERDLAHLDATAAHMRSEHKGSTTRIVVIGG